VFAASRSYIPVSLSRLSLAGKELIERLHPRDFRIFLIFWWAEVVENLNTMGKGDIYYRGIELGTRNAKRGRSCGNMSAFNNKDTA